MFVHAFYYILTCLFVYLYSDTVGRSGMFCAIMSTIERCKTEGVVDVFQVTKALRVQKPGAVLDVVRKKKTLTAILVTVTTCPTTHECIMSLLNILQEQYHSVFNAVLMYLDSFDTYANFQSV